MECRQCQAVLRPSDRFCLSCGAPVESGLDVPPPPSGGEVESGLDVPPPPVSPSPATHTASKPSFDFGSSLLRSVEVGPLALGGWPRAVEVATTILIVQVVIYMVPGLLQANAALLDSGAQPTSIANLFELPFRYLVAANGGVPMVGLYATGLFVTFFSCRLSSRRMPDTDRNLLMVTASAIKVALVYGVVMLLISTLVAAEELNLSPGLELPGTLASLSELGAWQRALLVVQSIVVVAGSLVVARWSVRRNKAIPVLEGLRSGVTATFILLVTAGLLVTLAGALQLETERTVQAWLASALELIATAYVSMVDLGASYFGGSVDGLFGEESVAPAKGPWVVVVPGVSLAVTAAYVVKVVRSAGSSLKAQAGRAAAVFVVGFGLVAAGAVDGIGGAMVVPAFVAVFVLMIVVSITSAPLHEWTRQRAGTGAFEADSVNG